MNKGIHILVRVCVEARARRRCATCVCACVCARFSGPLWCYYAVGIPVHSISMRLRLLLLMIMTAMKEEKKKEHQVEHLIASAVLTQRVCVKALGFSETRGNSAR